MRKYFALTFCLIAGLTIAHVAAADPAAEAKPVAEASDAKAAATAKRVEARKAAIDKRAMMIADRKLMMAINRAAPHSVVDHATIMAMEPGGKMRIVKQGDNGFTCMDPDNSPMCADKAAMEWVDAWQGHKTPPESGLGFIYMLSGDTGTSNTDPYATKEAPDNNWVKTGSHVMIVGSAAKEMAKAYPHDAKPDASKPYVMWPGTPYEHLMMPVR
jgi:hypothetical protein